MSTLASAIAARTPQSLPLSDDYSLSLPVTPCRFCSKPLQMDNEQAALLLNPTQKTIFVWHKQCVRALAFENTYRTSPHFSKTPLLELEETSDGKYITLKPANIRMIDIGHLQAWLNPKSLRDEMSIRMLDAAISAAIGAAPNWKYEPLPFFPLHGWLPGKNMPQLFRKERETYGTFINRLLGELLNAQTQFQTVLKDYSEADSQAWAIYLFKYLHRLERYMTLHSTSSADSEDVVGVRRLILEIKELTPDYIQREPTFQETMAGDSSPLGSSPSKF